MEEISSAVPAVCTVLSEVAREQAGVPMTFPQLRQIFAKVYAGAPYYRALAKMKAQNTGRGKRAIQKKGKFYV